MGKDANEKRAPVMRRAIAILWPSFILAGVATAVFFTSFDPAELFTSDHQLRMKRLGAYTIGFFLFWLLGATSSLLSLYFQHPPHDKT